MTDNIAQLHAFNNSGAEIYISSLAILHPMGDTPKAFRISELQAWEIAAAENLRALFVKHSVLTQKSFGQRYGIGSAGMVSQYLHARRPLGLKAAIKFAKGLEVEVADISPTLAAQLPKQFQTIGTQTTQSVSETQGAYVPTVVSPERGIAAIAEALALMTDAQREVMAGKLAALAHAPDSPTLKKSISESLSPAPLQPPDSP